MMMFSFVFFFLMLRRPPRSTRTDTLFPTRRSSDLDAEITRIQELHERMVRKYEAGALRDYFKLNEQIHQLILAAARNPTLAQMQLSLSGRVRRARYMANMSPARWTRAVAEHEKKIGRAHV